MPTRTGIEFVRLTEVPLPEVTALLNEPDRLARLKANARRLGRPRAAFNVVERSLALIPRSR
jgi:hypothetical protein